MKRSDLEKEFQEFPAEIRDIVIRATAEDRAQIRKNETIRRAALEYARRKNLLVSTALDRNEVIDEILAQPDARGGVIGIILEDFVGTGGPYGAGWWFGFGQSARAEWAGSLGKGRWNATDGKVYARAAVAAIREIARLRPWEALTISANTDGNEIYVDIHQDVDAESETSETLFMSDYSHFLRGVAIALAKEFYDTNKEHHTIYVQGESLKIEILGSLETWAKTCKYFLEQERQNG